MTGSPIARQIAWSQATGHIIAREDIASHGIGRNTAPVPTEGRAALAAAPPDETVAGRLEREIGSIPDPCGVAAGSGQSISTLGVLGAVSVNTAAGEVEVELRPTAPACLFVVYFEEEIRRIAASHLPGSRVIVRISDDGWVADSFPPEEGQPWAP